MSLELQRYGRGPDGFPYILTALPDGYWTPWHLADQQIRRLETRVEELEAGQAVGEAEDLRREVDGLRDLLHRMLEAPTTQVSVTWKDAVREALGGEAGQPAEPDEKCSPVGLRYKLPPLTMTGHQLRQALEFVQADDSPDALDTEVCLALRPGGTDTEGEKVEAGLCCWLAEYPEEGSILLDGRSLHDAPAAQADAQPAEPVLQECSDNDSPWLVCKPCAAAGKCKQADAQPVAPYQVKRLRDIAAGVRLYGAPDKGLLAARIERICDEISAAPPARQPQWMPIETAPGKGGGLVDILTDEGRRYAGCHWDSICGEYRHITACGVLIRLKNAAHWMPIPPPPGGIGREGE